MAFPLSCQAQNAVAVPAATFSPNKVYHADSLREDLLILQTALEEVHPGLYRHSSKEVMDAAFDDGMNSVRDSMTYFDFVRILSFINSPIHCVHTYGIHPPEYEKWRTDSLKHFPFLLRYLDQRWFVIENYSDNENLVPGTEISGISGEPMDKILEGLLPQLHSDGLNTTFKIRQLETQFAKVWSNYRDRSGIFHLQISRASDGKNETITVDGIPRDSLNARHGRAMALRGMLEPFRFSMSPDSGYAILRIRTFNEQALTGAGIKYSEKLHEIFTMMNESGVTQLIIDLRDNTGGQTSYGMLLASWLSPGVEYMDRVLLKKNSDYSFSKFISDSSGLEADSVKLLPTENEYQVWSNYPNRFYNHPIPRPFTGKVHLLVNGGTLSSAAIFTAVMHFNKRATVYGQETGGAYTGPNGSPLIVRLPHTGIRCAIPAARYEVAVPGVTETGGVKPDFEYSGHIDDVAGGGDPLMKVVMEFVKAGSKKPGGR